MTRYLKMITGHIVFVKGEYLETKPEWLQDFSGFALENTV